MSSPRFRLVVKTGAAAGQTFELALDEVIIGRSTQSHITIVEPELSRQHARFIRQGDGYILEDLGSTNGTFVNGVRLTAPRMLQPGDEIRLGPKTVMVYEPVVFDTEATVAVEPARAAARPAPAAPPSPPPPRPQPRVVGRVPAAAVTETPKQRNWWLIGCLAVLIIGACLVAGALWYIDANYLWCAVFPFLAGCP